MSRYARKVDLNQKEVTEELRNLGYEVILTHTLGKGFPDMIVVDRSFPVFVELKSEGGKLTPDEELFHKRTTLRIYTCYSVAEILDAIKEEMAMVGW